MCLQSIANYDEEHCTQISIYYNVPVKIMQTKTKTIVIGLIMLTLMLTVSIATTPILVTTVHALTKCTTQQNPGGGIGSTTTTCTEQGMTPSCSGGGGLTVPNPCGTGLVTHKQTAQAQTTVQQECHQDSAVQPCTTTKIH